MLLNLYSRPYKFVKSDFFDIFYSQSPHKAYFMNEKLRQNMLQTSLFPKVKRKLKQKILIKFRNQISQQYLVTLLYLSTYKY